jgi:hypothetical protein
LGALLTEAALKLAALSDKAKLSGIEPARLKGFVDQLEKAGVASDVAADSAGRFAGALADLSRAGSARYQALINMAGTHKAEMAAGIAEVQRAATIEEKFSKARELAEIVAKNRHDDTLRRTKDETTAAADAAKARIEFYQKLTDMDPSTLLLRHMENLTDAERKHNDELLANGRRAKASFDELKKSAEIVGESLLDAFGGPLAKALKTDAEDIEKIIKLLDKIEEWWGRSSSIDKGGSYTSPGKTGLPAQADLRKQGENLLRSGQGTRLLPDGSSVEQGAPQPQAPNGSSVGPGTGAGAGATGVTPGAPPVGSRGGSAGITAPTGTPIQHGGMATVTTASGKKFQVDARYAQNFQGFINDYEKAGGVIGPSSGTLGERPNPSGHPIGAAMDINQVGYGQRSTTGKTLPPAEEDQLARKWGLVSGHEWRRPDTGHFGVRSPGAAKQALIDNGVIPASPNGQTAGPGAGAGAGETPAGQTVKGSWFGSTPGWSDPSEPPGRKTAGGVSNQIPGIALPSREGLGKMYEVTTPDGRKFTLPQTDVGPAARTGRGIDITSAAAAQMGYTAKNFPTDKGFSYRRVGDDQPAADPMTDARKRLGDAMREKQATTPATDPMTDARQRLGDAMREKFGDGNAPTKFADLPPSFNPYTGEKVVDDLSGWKGGNQAWHEIMRHGRRGGNVEDRRFDAPPKSVPPPGWTFRDPSGPAGTIQTPWRDDPTWKDRADAPLSKLGEQLGGKDLDQMRSAVKSRYRNIGPDGEELDQMRSAVDRARNQNVNVNATGKLTANINAPPGTNVKMEGGGLFKKTEVNRQTQMVPASVGPAQAGGS